MGEQSPPSEDMPTRVTTVEIDGMAGVGDSGHRWRSAAIGHGTRRMGLTARDACSPSASTGGSSSD